MVSELDRPIAGYANLCPNMISTQAQEFELMLSTVKHEIIHALGFSAGLFAFYHDDDGKPLTPCSASGIPAYNESLGLYQWSEKAIKRATRLWDIRGGCMVRHNVHLLVTPRVVVSCAAQGLLVWVQNKLMCFLVGSLFRLFLLGELMAAPVNSYSSAGGLSPLCQGLHFYS
ncbi:leishmanolysin-like peptidase [Xyrauchen texanus]|uniref:leishmanolysin-like peptidase n=1 Tax=Xyrauchen texanus TaxID=154827 RepID=UPI00224279D9|nr:leishmanolysin-like peptidase [Xyrauchen texanus]